jgi:hypothetical protein
MPWFSCAVTDVSWLSEGPRPTKAELCDPAKVILLYDLSQYDACPLQLATAPVTKAKIGRVVAARILLKLRSHNREVGRC